jgi:hypothetical protein
MAETPDVPNSLRPRGRGRSIAEGDAPDALLRRYYLDGRGGAGLGFYVDARVATPAFRDTGRELVAARADPNSIRDMVAIARHREWRVVVARGASEFRREAWLVGRAEGIEVRGYRPTERDMQELDRRTAARERLEARGGGRLRGGGTDRDHADPNAHAGARSRLRTVETVVRSRVADPDAQSRILASARERLASWLERGARFEPLPTPAAQHRTIEPATPRERHRGR